MDIIRVKDAYCFGLSKAWERGKMYVNKSVEKVGNNTKRHRKSAELVNVNGINLRFLYHVLWYPEIGSHPASDDTGWPADH